MKCSVCGTEFSEGTFCPECGSKFEENSVKGKDEPGTRKYKPNKKRWKYIGIIALIYIVVSIILTLLNGGIDDSETHAEVRTEEKDVRNNFETEQKADIKVDEIEVVDTESDLGSTDKYSLGWKEAYLNYLEENGNADYGYSLSYIDEDDIPELVIDTQIAASGIEIGIYDGNDIVITPVGESLMYRLQENSFCVSGGGMDYYYDIVYEIIDGVPVEISKGEYGILDYENLMYDEAGDIIYQYSWNGESISEYDYYMNTESFSFENGDVWPAARGYLYDVIDVLSHPLDVTIITPYLNDNGYMSMLNNYVIMFDGISEDKVHFSVSYNGELVGSASAMITSARTAEYKNANSELVIEFEVDGAQLNIEGYMNTIDLTGDYHGIWG